MSDESRIVGNTGAMPIRCESCGHVGQMLESTITTNAEPTNETVVSQPGGPANELAVYESEGVVAGEQILVCDGCGRRKVLTGEADDEGEVLRG